MILSPGILALLAVCGLVAAYSIYAAATGLRILVGWDAASASEAQLWRERRSTLLSWVLGFVMGADLLCLAFFVGLAERLHVFLTGAMCAAGTLGANAYGYPTLLAMVAGFLLSVLWLLVNRLDAGAPNTALVRLKYLALVPVAVVLGTQAVLLVNFFARLDPAFITSCCGTFFDAEREGLGADLAHLPPALMRPVFWVTWGATCGVGLIANTARRWDGLYAVLSAAMLPIGLAAILSFVSVSIYDLPTHHCPFCLLQGEYDYVGYLLYAGLFLGATLGLGIGAVRLVGRHAGLAADGLSFTRRLKAWSLAGYALFGLLALRPSLDLDFQL